MRMDPSYHDRIDERRLRGRELQGSLVHHLASLGVSRHHKLGVGALGLRPLDECGKGGGPGWVAAFVKPSYIRSVVDLSQNRASISKFPSANRGHEQSGKLTPCTATLLAPTLPTTAWKNGGPARVPTLPDSVVPRAKRIVMARQGVPSVSWFSVFWPAYWRFSIGLAMAKAARDRERSNFMMG